MSRVYLACPSYGGTEPECVSSIVHASQGKHQCAIVNSQASLLAYGFNEHWCRMLNTRAEMKYDYFAMIHSDIGVEAFWLDKLIDELIGWDIDLLSVVIPIKNKLGITSTGIYNDNNNQVKRFTMKEIFTMADTFSIDNYKDKKEGDLLVVNTGLWITRLTNPNIEKVHFEIKDAITKLPNGQFVPMTMPEDWGLSIQYARLGMKVMATRKVKASHFGRAEFRNDSPWGELQVDNGANHTT
jgi:hypothetical protein